MMIIFGAIYHRARYTPQERPTHPMTWTILKALTLSTVSSLARVLYHSTFVPDGMLIPAFLITFYTLEFLLCYSWFARELLKAVLTAWYRWCRSSRWLAGLWTSATNGIAIILVLLFTALDDCQDPKSYVSDKSSSELTGLQQNIFENCIKTIHAPDSTQHDTSVYERAMASLKAKHIDEPSSEDILQESMINTCRRYATTLEIDQIEPYFYVVVKNEASDYKKARAKYDPRPFSEEHYCSVSHRDEQRYADRELINKMYCHLEPRERQIFEMRAHGFSHEEIAAELNISAANTRKQWERLTKKIIQNQAYR